MATDLSHRNPSFLALALSKEFLNFTSAFARLGLHSHLDVPSMCRLHGRYRYTYGVVSLSERGSCILSLMTFIELARCRYDDGLSAAHIAD